MEISVTLGHDSDNGVCVSAGEEALHLHREVHPAEADGGA